MCFKVCKFWGLQVTESICDAHMYVFPWIFLVKLMEVREDIIILDMDIWWLFLKHCYIYSSKKITSPQVLVHSSKEYRFRPQGYGCRCSQAKHYRSWWTISASELVPWKKNKTSVHKRQVKPVWEEFNFLISTTERLYQAD